MLFIMCDDPAAHAMSSYDNRANTTPEPDRVAQSGVRFGHCFFTNSITARTRAPLLASTYNVEIGPSKVVPGRVADILTELRLRHTAFGTGTPAQLRNPRQPISLLGRHQ